MQTINTLLFIIQEHTCTEIQNSVHTGNVAVYVKCATQICISGTRLPQTRTAAIRIFMTQWKMSVQYLMNNT